MKAFTEFPQSISEDRGLALIKDSDLEILSLGISTAGVQRLKWLSQTLKDISQLPL